MLEFFNITRVVALNNQLLYIPIFNVYSLLSGFLIIIATRIIYSYYNSDLYLSIIKNFIMILIAINFILVLFKFITQFLLLQHQIAYLSVVNFTLFLFPITFTWNLLGTSLLILCYVTSLVCISCLGDKNLFNNNLNVYFFLFFLVCTTFLVGSTNLLIIFLSFEFIFVPSLFFVYKLGYVKKVDKTIYYLLIWTLLGSFLVLFALVYLFKIVGSLELETLKSVKYSSMETITLYSIFFIGYGVKIPLFPFHYWLTKVHVEAPAGFSIFLSGFLVKTAAYCFYFITLIFSVSINKFFFILWILISIVDSSFKMWNQLDLKKLIAFATIQEMNMILFYLLVIQQPNMTLLSVFFLMHGLLSSYMFLFVDQVQQRTQTRSVVELSGLNIQFPFFTKFIWVLLILFLGFPLTVKFVIEWNLAVWLITYFHWLGLIAFAGSMIAGGLAFLKIWLGILYGNPTPFLKQLKLSAGDVFQKDQYIIYNLIFLLSLLNFCIYIYWLNKK